MKKGWKIALAALGGLLALVAIAVAVACWLLFTPSRLTAIVNDLTGKYVACESHFERVDLTLFKTYPNVGLEVSNVVLLSPYEPPMGEGLAQRAAHSDTLASVGSVAVGLDLKALVGSRSVVVRQLRVDDARVNLYTAPDGSSNLDCFLSAEKEEDNESEGSLPSTIQLEKIAVNRLAVQYCNLQQNMLARVDDLNLNLKGSMGDGQAEADLRLEAQGVLADVLDSIGADKLQASLDRLTLTLEGDGSAKELDGKLKLAVDKGDVALNGQHYVTDAMRQSGKELLSLSLPFHANVEQKTLTLGRKTCLELVGYALGVWGDVALANGEEPMRVDVGYEIDRWMVADLLAMLPPAFTQSLDGMDIDAKVSVSGTAKGPVADGQLPRVEAEARLEKGSFVAPKWLPAPLKDIDAKVAASLDLSTDSAGRGAQQVQIDHLSAKMMKSALEVKGRVEDLTGDMLVDARVSGNVHLPDLHPFLPDTMPVALQGSTQANLRVKGRLSHLKAMDLKKITAGGTLDFSHLDVLYDSIHATSPKLNVALSLPTKKTNPKVQELLGAHVTGKALKVEMPSMGLDAKVSDPDLQVGLPNILDSRQALAAAFDIRFSKVNATMDSMRVNSDTLRLKGSVRNDKRQDNVLKQWNPDVDIDLHRGVLSVPGVDHPLRLTDFVFNYQPQVVNIAKADVLLGVSDYHLNGKIYGLEDWLSHTRMMTGELDFTSSYADVDELMAIFSGMGSDKDTLQLQREEDNVPKEANPFIVPKDVRVRLNTNVRRCVAFGNDLNDLAGSVTVNDGVAVLDQIGFTCKAARMELTGVYKSPRVNHLFVGLDFHLLDIQIEELLDMIPSIDTLVPMLAAFQGKANFHLAAECNLNAFYKPKMSTLIGAAAISGQDLVVMDNATVAQMARLLQFKNWREKDNNIGIDSISVEAQVFRKEITVYPFLLQLHNYQLCIGGRHTLDNNCNYHLELLKCPLPMRLAVDVNGNLKKPIIALGKVQYADLFRPEKQNQLEARTMEIKRMVRQALEANVRRRD